MLKLLACVLMLIDHFGYFFIDFVPPQVYMAARALGRLSFPIFAYYVALGFRRTRSPFRYLLRMALFALVTEGILHYASSVTGFSFPPNVMVTFTTAIVFLIGSELAGRSWHDMVSTMKLVRSTAGPCSPGMDFPVRILFNGTGLPPSVGLPLGVVVAAAAIAVNLIVSPDYGIYGLLHVLIFHLTAARIRVEDPDPACVSDLKNRTWTGILALNLAYLPFRVLFENVPFDRALLQCLSVLAVALILAGWPDRKPGLVAKYGFYVFYPLHIAILMGVSYALH